MLEHNINFSLDNLGKIPFLKKTLEKWILNIVATLKKKSKEDQTKKNKKGKQMTASIYIMSPNDTNAIKLKKCAWHQMKLSHSMVSLGNI